MARPKNKNVVNPQKHTLEYYEWDSIEAYLINSGISNKVVDLFRDDQEWANDTYNTLFLDELDYLEGNEKKINKLLVDLCKEKDITIHISW